MVIHAYASVFCTRRKLTEIFTLFVHSHVSHNEHIILNICFTNQYLFCRSEFLSTGKFIRLLNIINEIKLARCFNFTSRYVDDVLSLTISTFGDFVDCISPTVPNLKDVSRLVVILAHTTCMLKKVCMEQIFNSDVLMVQPTGYYVYIMKNRISYTA